MDKLYNNISARMVCLLTFATALIAPATHAQQGSSGNTTIFGGAEMTFFSTHNFNTGGGGSQPGIINTVRTSPFGILNFGPDANTTFGGDDVNYVDGYVRKLGTTAFVFPVGDNGQYGPFAAKGDGTMGAYYFTDPTSAVTSTLPSGNYPVLPAGGPFPSATFDDALEAVSTIEYWDIDGGNATPLTLTWDATSAISSLTAAQLNKLTIAGWDGSQWVAIPSVVDVVSILGGNSELTAGSITTNSSIVPDTYTAYTFASRDTPLPVTLIAFSVHAEGNSTILQWSTTMETNSDRFEIERSSNGKDFNKIGLLASHKESSQLKNYTFVDNDPLNGENLYRLKMVDQDETYAYSRIRSVKFESAGLFVYPNPATERLLIKEPGSVKQLTIYNTAGQKVLEATRVPAQGIDLNKLASGNYTVKITQVDGLTNTSKIVVVK